MGICLQFPIVQFTGRIDDLGQELIRERDEQHHDKLVGELVWSRRHRACGEGALLIFRRAKVKSVSN